MVEAVATWPVAGIGTLLFDWQTGPQPEPWVTGASFNVAIGLVLYGVLGASGRGRICSCSQAERVMRQVVTRILAGWAVWLVLVAIFYGLAAGGWKFVPGVVHTIVGLAAWPMAIGVG